MELKCPEYHLRDPCIPLHLLPEETTVTNVMFITATPSTWTQKLYGNSLYIFTVPIFTFHKYAIIPYILHNLTFLSFKTVLMLINHNV